MCCGTYLRRWPCLRAPDWAHLHQAGEYRASGSYRVGFTTILQESVTHSVVHVRTCFSFSFAILERLPIKFPGASNTLKTCSDMTSHDIT